MKTLTYNENNLTEENINKVVKRAKVVIENDQGEIIIVKSHNNYFFIGGHVENNEKDIDCLTREVKEETGISIPVSDSKLFFSITYYLKDYPNLNENTKYIANYYYLHYNLIPDTTKTSLTEEEINGNFTLEYIKRDQILNILNNSLIECTRPNVVKDTINVTKEYLNMR